MDFSKCFTHAEIIKYYPLAMFFYRKQSAGVWKLDLHQVTPERPESPDRLPVANDKKHHKS